MADHIDEIGATEGQCLEIANRLATCPFVGAAVSTGELPLFSELETPLARIKTIEALGNTGGGDLGTRVLRLFASGNHCRWVTSDSRNGSLIPEHFFCLNFGGSQGAHAGHSGILLGNPDEIGTGRFSAIQFERLLGHADKSGRLSIDAIGDFIADSLKQDEKTQILPWVDLVRQATTVLLQFRDTVLTNDPNEKTLVLEAVTNLLGTDHLAASCGEWGLMFAFLKNSPNSDDGDIAVDDVEIMFVQKQFPVGWEQWEKSSLIWVKATWQLVKDAAFAYHAGWK